MASQNFLPRIAMQVFNNPLMIEPGKLEVIMRVLGPRIGLQGMEPVPESEMASRRTPLSTNQTSIGIVPIIGSMTHREIDAGSGVISYEGIVDRFDAVHKDPSVSAVLLDIGSNGGAVEGCFAAADHIYQAGKTKPVYAFANESAYSAGYLLASAAKKIFVPQTGGVGSIGVRMVHVDQSEYDKKQGVKYTPLYVGERKMDFDPHSALSEPAMNAAMSDLNELYALFVKTVAMYRGMPESRISATEAGLFMGQHAVIAGLADHVMSFNEVISYIVDDLAVSNNSSAQSKRAGNRKGVFSMNTLEELKAEKPDLFEMIMGQAKAEVKGELQAVFNAKENGLQEQISSLKGELKKQHETVLKLEKEGFIRAENERRAHNEATAETIWVKALSGCDIPEDMHSKVRKMVKAEDFLKEGKLDQAAFQESVDGEIAEWEGKGMVSRVKGAGAGRVSSGASDLEAKSKAKQEAEDDVWADEMAQLAGEKGGTE